MVWTGANRNWVDAVDAKSGLPVEGSAEHLELQRIIEKANSEDLQESARKFIEIVQKAGGFSIPGFGSGEAGVTSITNAAPQNPADRLGAVRSAVQGRLRDSQGSLHPQGRQGGYLTGQPGLGSLKTR